MLKFLQSRTQLSKSLPFPYQLSRLSFPILRTLTLSDSNFSMEQPATKTQDPDLNPKGFSLSNGTPKKAAYRECLKNHAASLGGHALDGCGEFMPSLAANPSDPTSLKCAACGCHRNFHRRIAFLHVIEGEAERFGDNDYGEEDDLDGSRPRSPSPQVLLALRTGIRDGDSPAVTGKPFAIRTPVMAAAVPPLRKRFRSRFSSEQKERMVDLCEKLGWRMQKKDEELVDKCCSEIGVSKGVFKVWMHNNKHHLFGQLSSRRGDPTNVGASNDAGAAINGSD